MESKEKSALNIVNNYSDLLKSKGYKIFPPEKKEYSYTSVISNGRNSVMLVVYFGKKGNKVILQGNKESELYNDVDKIIFGEKLFAPREEKSFDNSDYIGTDESGKGDYFGPLVIAGVYSDPETNIKLKNFGVRDSKLLTDNSIKSVSLQIKKILVDKFNVIFISPEKYNSLHKKMGNVNRVLGWAHAKVIENILEIFDVKEAVSDKFGSEKLILDSLQERGKTISLHQTTKAERYTAVAAASILARESVVRWFEINSAKYGVKIPKGSSNLVEIAAKEIINKFGADELKILIKNHFKTSKKIF